MIDRSLAIQIWLSFNFFVVVFLSVFLSLPPKAMAVADEKDATSPQPTWTCRLQEAHAALSRALERDFTDASMERWNNEDWVAGCVWNFEDLQTINSHAKLLSDLAPDYYYEMIERWREVSDASLSHDQSDEARLANRLTGEDSSVEPLKCDIVSMMLPADVVAWYMVAVRRYAVSQHAWFVANPYALPEDVPSYEDEEEDGIVCKVWNSMYTSAKIAWTTIERARNRAHVIEVDAWNRVVRPELITTHRIPNDLADMIGGYWRTVTSIEHLPKPGDSLDML
jgi:hypothetical protein